nr:TipAS antibiotic-recognition domain-containing protein [Thalassobacillus sp. CUG 92003]
MLEWRDQLNADAEIIRHAEQEFKAVSAELQSCLQNGIPATDESVQALAHRWRKLANHFTVDAPDMQRASEAFHEDGKMGQGVGDNAIYAYIRDALK